MKFKKLARVLCIGALAATIGAAAALSGCTIETKHPRATITIEFNGTTYELEYTLYRNMYPVTVRHFIELAESGFYNNTIIHNYATSDWYGGGYSYITEDEADEEHEIYAYADSLDDSDAAADYLQGADKESEYISLSSSLTTSVYTNYSNYSGGDMTVSGDDAYYSLYGEFENNGHTVKNGQRGSDYGSIKMYYTAKNITNLENSQVYVKTDNGEVLVRDYEYNSATSLFAIQTGESSALSTSSYASFAYLRNDDAVDTFDDLLEAVQDYIDDLGDEDSFTVTAEDVGIDNQLADVYGGPSTADYTITIEPIIIRSVKITKY